MSIVIIASILSVAAICAVSMHCGRQPKCSAILIAENVQRLGGR